MTLAECPTADQLAAFVLGALSEAGLADLAHHLEACAACTARVESLDKLSDPVIAGLRHGKDTPVRPTLPERLGDYRIMREIGRGGMGIVYEAKQESLGRHVALKVLPGHVLLDPRRLQRFQREARAAGRLHHTNIVPVYGVGEADGLHYYVMQFIQGLSLDEVLSELRRLRQSKTPSAAARAQSLLMASGERQLPDGSLDQGTHVPRSPGSDAAPSTLTEIGRPYWQSVARMGVQVAEALAYAAGHGILHRDIKPSNLLLDGQGTVWITDFGLAKEEADPDHLTASGDVVGTLRYLAPERFTGQGNVRADLYSLGLTLYELLTLRPAFPETDRHKLLQHVLRDEPPGPRKLDPRVPRDLETIVQKAMAREPAERYQTPTEMADDLQRFLDDRPIRARRASLREQLWRWCRRNPAVASLSAACLLALALGLAGVLWKWQEAVQAKAEAVAKSDALQRQSAELLLDRGLALANQGEVAPGTLWMLESLQGAPEEARAFRSLVRANVAAWLGRVPRTVAHGAPITCVAFSPDGQTFVTGGEDHLVRLWESATGRPRRITLRLDGPVSAVALSPNGQILLTGWTPDPISVPGTAGLWEVATGQPIGKPLRHASGVNAVAFSPDGKTCATGCVDHSVRFWDVATGRPSETVLNHEGPVQALAFSPDGSKLLTGSEDKTAQLWEVATGQRVGPPLRHGALVNAVAFNPDGLTLATGSEDKTARLWDAASGAAQGPPLRHPGLVLAVAFSPDGRTFVTSSTEGIIRLWDAASREQISSLRGHEWNTRDVVFSPDGRTILSGSLDGTARLWPVSTRVQRFRSTATTRPRALFQKVAYGPDKTALVTDETGRARLWDATAGRPIGPPLRHPWNVRAMAFSPNGKLVATSSYDLATWACTVHLWDATTGRPVCPPLVQANQVLALAFSPDNQLLATGDFSWNARFWDTRTGQAVGRPLRHSDVVLSVAFHPDGHQLATGTAAGWSGRAGAHLWDLASGRLLGGLMPHEHRVRGVEFSADGHILVTITTDNAARLWDAGTSQAIGQPMPMAPEAASTAFSPDGKLLATGGADGMTRLWDATTGRALGEPLPQGSSVRAVAFSPDSKTLLTGHADGSAQLWDVVGFRPIGPPLLLHYALLGVAFSADGQSFLTTTDDGDMRRWPVPQPIAEDAHRLALRLQVWTNLHIDRSQKLVALDEQSRREKARLLEQAEQTSAARLPAQTAEQLGFGVAGTPAWHERNARDAEQEGASFATLWHLNRLLAISKQSASAGPERWLLYARRARAWEQARQLDKAAAEYQLALKHCQPDLLLDWYRQRVVECEALGQWSTALWHLGRLIASCPGDWQLYAERGTVCERLQQARQSASDYAQAVELGADRFFRARRARDDAAHGQWEKAAAECTQLVDSGPVLFDVWKQSALTFLKVGDQNGYRKVCAAFLQWLGEDATDLDLVGAVAWICALSPDALGDYRKLLSLVDYSVARYPPRLKERRARMLRAQGALRYRAGHYQQALDSLHEGITANAGQSTLQDWIFLALVHRRLGHGTEGRASLDRVRTSKPAEETDQFWENVEAELLRREVEAILQDRSAEFK